MTTFCCDMNESVDIDVTAPDTLRLTVSHAWGTASVTLTAEEARTVAARLLEAADQSEK